MREIDLRQNPKSSVYSYSKKTEQKEEILEIGGTIYKIIDGTSLWVKREETMICFGHPPFPKHVVWNPVFATQKKIEALRKKAKKWHKLYWEALRKVQSNKSNDILVIDEGFLSSKKQLSIHY